MASSTNSGGAASLSKGSGGSGSAASRPKIIAAGGGAEVVEEKLNDTVDGSSDKGAVEGLYSGGDVNGGSKKPVWNKPSNGALEVEPVMGADSWPALSDTAKGPQKSSGEYSKNFTEASMPILQGTGPVSPAHKRVTNNPHPNSIQHNAHPARQKSFKRHVGNASSTNVSTTQPPAHPSFSQSASVPSDQNTTSSHKNFNLESGQKVASESQSHGTNDRPQHSNPHRRINGPQQHGDSSYNHRYGARKDQDRPNRDWNSQRSFNGRDIHPQATGVVPRGVVRHIPMQHSSAMYVPPPLSPTMRPFGPPVSYPEFPFYYVPVQPESIRGMSIPYPTPAPPPLFMQYIDPELYSKVINQIDYYFSNENLIKDVYLRSNMDEQGWVPIELIAGFKQVKKLTDNIAFIREAIQASTVVEVMDDKVRRRNDWMKWLMPASLKVSPQPTYLDHGSSSEFVDRFQKINIDAESSDIPSSGGPASHDQGH
ncbi:unnamed protein product [Rhodiola kirilowii]